MSVELGTGLGNVHFVEYSYFRKSTFRNPAPEGHTDALRLTYIPQLLAKYIQYQYINSTDIYSPMYRFVLDRYCY